MSGRVRPSINASWQQLLERYDIPAQIARDGSYIISADTINTVREARLMAKFDEMRNLPSSLRAHGIRILPISRGYYVLGPYETYTHIDYPKLHQQPIKVPNLDTLTPSLIQNEAEALHFLASSRVWETVFESTQVTPTISGRRSSGRFEFSIKRTDKRRQDIHVDNAQIEIDAGYETPDALYMCEAKNRHVSELHVRQLYYPFRYGMQRTTKPVIPVSVIFSNQTFYITRYTFPDPRDYSSISIDKRFCFSLDQQMITYTSLQAAYASKAPPDPAVYTQIPFPQADNFTLIWRLCEALAQRPYTVADVTSFLTYTERQSGYYTNAGRSLGMIESYADNGVTTFRLTDHGRRVMQAAPHRQKALLIEAMMIIPVFHELFPQLLHRHAAPSRAEIITAMQLHPLLMHNKDSTINRRASTVAMWFEWVVQQLQDEFS